LGMGGQSMDRSGAGGPPDAGPPGEDAGDYHFVDVMEPARNEAIQKTASRQCSLMVVVRKATSSASTTTSVSSESR